MGPKSTTHQPTTHQPSKPQPTKPELPLLGGIQWHWAPIDQRPKPKIQDRRGALKAPPSTSRWPKASIFDLQTRATAVRRGWLRKTATKNHQAACFFSKRVLKDLMKLNSLDSTKFKKTSHQRYHRVHRPQTCWDGIELPLAHDYTPRRRSDPRQCLLWIRMGRQQQQQKRNGTIHRQIFWGRIIFLIPATHQPI